MKKILIGFAAFIILLLGAAVAFPFVFKDKIIQATKDAANQELNAVLNFESLDVSLLQNIKNFPDITLVVNKPVISGAGQFHSDTLIQMDKLMLALDIKSIFQTEQPMSIHAVDIVNAKIFAKVAADSAVNWDILKPSKTDDKPTKFALDIERIGLDNIDIKYIDIPANNNLEIFGLNHTGKGNFSENIVNYTSQTHIEDMSFFSGLIPYLKNVTLQNESEITIDQAAKKYSFAKNHLLLNQLDIVVNGIVQQLDKDAMNLQLDFATERNDFKQILSLIPAIYKQDFDKVETKGNFDLKGKINGLYQGNIYPKMDISLDVHNGEFQYPSLPQKVSNIQISANIKSNGGSLDNVVTDIPKFSMLLGQDPFEGRLKLLQPLSNPYIELYAKGKLNLADVQKFYPMEGVKQLTGLANIDLDLNAKQSDIKAKNYGAIKALGSAQIKGITYESATIAKPLKISDILLNFSPQYVDVPSCLGSIGSTDFNLKARLENFIGYYLSKDGVMSGNINLVSNKVDLNEFTSDEKSSDYVMVPTKVDFKGTAAINEMKYGKMTITKISGGIGIKEEKIMLENVNAELLGGRAKMDAIYSTVGQTKPLTAVRYDIESFDIKQVYDYMESAPKLAPIMKYMTGKLSSKSSLTMSLLPDMSPDLTTLNGDFNVSIPFAKIINVPMLQKITEVTKLDFLNPLETTNLKANMSFDKGKIVLQPTQFKAKDMNVSIAGLQGLDKSIDYKMAVDVPFAKLGNATSVVNGLISKFKIPFIGNINPETVRLNLNIKGFFDQPQVSLGAPEILSGGKPTDAKTAALDAVKKTGEDIKNQAIKTADSIKNVAIQEAQKKVDEIKQEAEKKAEEVKKKAEEEANKKKEELLNELKKKLPW